MGLLVGGEITLIFGAAVFTIIWHLLPWVMGTTRLISAIKKAFTTLTNITLFVTCTLLLIAVLEPGPSPKPAEPSTSSKPPEFSKGLGPTEAPLAAKQCVATWSFTDERNILYYLEDDLKPIEHSDVTRNLRVHVNSSAQLISTREDFGETYLRLRDTEIPDWIEVRQTPQEHTVEDSIGNLQDNHRKCKSLLSTSEQSSGALLNALTLVEKLIRDEMSLRQSKSVFVMRPPHPRTFPADINNDDSLKHALERVEEAARKVAVLQKQMRTGSCHVDLVERVQADWRKMSGHNGARLAELREILSEWPDLPVALGPAMYT